MELKTIKDWLASSSVSEDLKEELRAVTDEKEIEERFYKNLEFGTGGLRGIIGAGNNRMNVLTVGKATQGFAVYLNKHNQNPSVCIAHDTRNMSREFAEAAAKVLCANGIKVYLFDSERPTPMLSYSVLHQKASGGIVITASHNPKIYNGYKVYGPDGGQITDVGANEILGYINDCDIFTDIKSISLDEAKNQGLLVMVGEEIDAPYYEKIKGLVLNKELVKNKASDLKIIYTPIHGSGNKPVRRVLSELGFSNVLVVKEQEQPDGNFPTAPYPNPEIAQVFELAIKMAQTENPDLIFATDPDCDRIGVITKNEKGEYVVLTGNQIGILICEYVLSAKKCLGILEDNAAVVTTIVSTQLVTEIAKKYNAEIFHVLTGFKYIGEKISTWEKNKEHTFVFGFEESYGYLTSTFVRDKDAVNAAVIIAEMALHYKQQGKTLYDAINAIYEEYGYYCENTISIELPGKEGHEKIVKMMEDLRSDYVQKLKGKNVEIFEDYKESVRINEKTGDKQEIKLPKSNVLKFYFDDGTVFVIRPSGTEPKVKLYTFAKADTKEKANQKIKELEDFVMNAIK